MDLWSPMHRKNHTARQRIWTAVAITIEAVNIDDLPKLTRAYRLGDHEEGRGVREEAGISLRTLAGALGTNQGELSRWERGITRPRPASALAWLRAVELLRAERVDA